MSLTCRVEIVSHIHISESQPVEAHLAVLFRTIGDKMTDLDP